MSLSIGPVVFHQYKDWEKSNTLFYFNYPEKESGVWEINISGLLSAPPPPGCISDQGRQITFPSCLTPNYPSEWRERESFDKVWKSASAFLSTSGWICQASCNSRFLLKTIREHPAQTGSVWVFVGPSAMAVHLEGPVFAVGVPSSARWIISSLEKVALPAHINASLLHELGTNIGI